MPIKLSLTVQFATPSYAPSRATLRRWVQRTLDLTQEHLDPSIQAATFTVRLVDADEGRHLNRQFRQRDKATNVLTFDYGTDPDGRVSADIVLCVDVIEREAVEQTKSLDDHAAHLTIHGVLHALGYDHLEPEDATEMETLEIHILERLGIANPYTA